MLTIEQAQRSDVPDIVALLADDFLGAGRERTGDDALQVYLAAFDAIDRDPNNTLYVARDSGLTVGCFQLTFVPGLSFGGRPRAQIESVRTLTSRRGQGIGQTMMAFAVARAREHGCCLVQLSTHKQRSDAHRFYERIGFVASHEGMKLALV